MRRRLGLDASRGFDGPVTGTERYAREVIAGLVAGARYDCTLYLRRPPAAPLPAPAQVRLLPAPRLWTHTRLLAAVARDRPAALFVPAHVLPFWCPVPAVVTVHDVGFHHFPAAHPVLQRWYLEVTTRRHVRRATRLVVDSEATRDDLVRHYGAEPARIAVAHLGVGPEFQPKPAEALRVRDRLGLAPDAEVVLHVGTRQPRKNLARLVAAFAAVAADRPRAHLVLAGGEGWGGDESAAVAARGLGNRVRMPGYWPAEDLPALYSAATVYALPSLYEGFGLTALEAMACGVPVVAAATSSLPEVVGDAGMLLSPTAVDDWTAALLGLLRAPERAAEQGAAGRRRAADFPWSRTVARVAAAIDAAMTPESR